MTLKTPDFHHLTTEDLDHVYEPSEDTFLLIDALELDLKFILSVEPSCCLEVGSGSGVVITALGMYLGTKCRYITTDVNKWACKVTQKTGEINNVDIEVHNSNLVDAVEEDLKGIVDVLIFNPPYVVTTPEEVGCGDLEYTWAGGVDGREVMDQLFPKVSSLLSEKGVFYLVVLKENGIEDVIQLMKQYSLEGTCLLTRKCRSECLSVLKFCKVSD